MFNFFGKKDDFVFIELDEGIKMEQEYLRENVEAARNEYTWHEGEAPLEPDHCHCLICWKADVSSKEENILVFLSEDERDYLCSYCHQRFIVQGDQV